MRAAWTVFLLLSICYITRATIRVRRINGRQRVKRAWSYPDIKTTETPPGAPFDRKKLVDIDSDSANAQRYGLTGAAVDAGKFSIVNEAGHGTVWQEVPLDREEQEKYVLVASALDNRGQKVEDDIPLTIIVGDINDNKPVFVQSTLTASVQEDARPSFMFHTVKATDADSAVNDNNKVRFSKVGDETPSGNRFAVSSNGQISVIGNLDAEKEPEVSCVVQAVDSYPGGPGYTVTATLTINVLDANDHAPVFVGTPYSVQVGELKALNSPFITLEATDADKGLNSEVTFLITRGDNLKLFHIKSYPSAAGKSTAQISLQKPLDYETLGRQYDLEITAFNQNATNAGFVAYHNKTNVHVEVLDENEPPLFINVPYSGSVKENSPPPQSIISVEAVDSDFGGTQTVTYTLENPEGWFSIDSNGYITANQELDREHPSVNQETSQYILKVRATDNDPTNPKYSTSDVTITINDENDNAPEPLGGGWNAFVCEKPPTPNVTMLAVEDKDTNANGPPYKFSLVNPNSKFQLEADGDTDGRQALVTTSATFDISEKRLYEVLITISDSPATGQNPTTGTGTLTVTVCNCDSDGNQQCGVKEPVSGASIPLIISIIAALLIILIIVLAVVAYRRRQRADLEKQHLFIDDDDVRENLQAYHDEGGGEEDNDGYDMSALQPLPPGAPARIDEKPQRAEPQTRPRIPPDTDIGDYINDAKKQADGDPTAPPFDSLLVFDYEGQGSDAGSLSSLNSGTTDGSQDYDHLHNWGPRFQKLADMYGGGVDED